MTIELQKSSLRREFAARRRNLTAAERAAKSRAIARNIAQAPWFASASGVAFYAADAVEADLRELFAAHREGKTWFLPRYNAESEAYDMVRINDFEQDLKAGRYGILEPGKDLPALDKKSAAELLYLVPGVAFDACGNRIGRGKGFYDRILSGRENLAVGIFFDCQRTSAVPAEAHDARLDMAVTETGVWDFSMIQPKKKG